MTAYAAQDCSSRPLRVLHVASGLWMHTGGPAEIVPSLCGALAQHGCQVTLAMLDGPIHDNVWACQEAGVELRIFRPNMRHTIWYSREMGRAMPGLVATADIVHVHALWEYPGWVAGASARRSGKLLVMMPLGLLRPQALRRSRYKKLLAGMLFDNRNLRVAACLHATSDAEREGVRRYGLHNPVAVIPCGVEIVIPTGPAAPERLYERFPECQGKRLLLFLSRINPTKGLLDLAAAWGQLAAAFPQWHLLIAGPDVDGHWQQVSAALRHAGVLDRTTYVGALYGEDKAAALATAELFVLPTHTESFGMVVAESLAAGTPVITTHGAPWKGLVDNRCGWWVPVGADAIMAALQQALPLPAHDLRQMGERGRRWVEREFTWDGAAAQMLEVYRWLLGQGPIPPCVCKT